MTSVSPSGRQIPHGRVNDHVCACLCQRCRVQKNTFRKPPLSLQSRRSHAMATPRTPPRPRSASRRDPWPSWSPRGARRRPPPAPASLRRASCGATKEGGSGLGHRVNGWQMKNEGVNESIKCLWNVFFYASNEKTTEVFRRVPRVQPASRLQRLQMFWH